MNRKKKRKNAIRWFPVVFLILCIVAGYGIWNQMIAVHAYESATASRSRTYPNGYYDILISGPSGTERMNLYFTYSGSEITQDDFNNASRTISIKRGYSNNGVFVAESSGVYGAKLLTTSVKTSKNSAGNYARLKFNISFNQPAHQQYSSVTGEKINALSSTINTGTLNYSASSGAHSSSSRTVTVACDVSVYATGIVTFKSGSKFYRYWNSYTQCNLKKNNYILSYNANGGSVSATSKIVACGGTYGTLPSAWRTGYSLKGWNNQSNGSGSWANSSWVVCSGNHTVYAIWTPKQYTIAYDGNGADSGSMQSTTATYDSNVTLAGNGFTKKGYAFLGWSTDAGATSAAYTNGQTFPWKQDGNMTLYAVWSKDNYEVELYGNGASGEKRTETIKYGQASALPKNKFERSGYTFLGWSTKEDALLPEYTDEQAVTNLCDAGDTFSLYAIWKKTDGSFDLTNIIHDEGMFNGSVELKGQNGTEFLREWIDSTYARIDKPNTPGYFSSRY